MPARKGSSRRPNADAAGRPVKTFRRRYGDLEQARLKLLERLHCHMKVVHAHPSARRALKLLTTTFRNARVAQRAAILHAAEWLVCLIERTPPSPPMA